MKAQFNVIACIFFSAIFVSIDPALGSIIVIEQSHHVYGYASDYYGGQSYDFTDDTLVAGTAQYGTKLASSSAGNFNVSASYSDTTSNYTASEYGYAESSYVFRPTSSLLSLSIDGAVAGKDPYNNWVRFQLRNITGYSELVHYDFRKWFYMNNINYKDGFTIQYQQAFSVTPDHLYQLYLYAEGYNREYANTGSANITAQLNPEPATTFAIGLR